MTNFVETVAVLVGEELTTDGKGLETTYLTERRAHLDAYENLSGWRVLIWEGEGRVLVLATNRAGQSVVVSEAFTDGDFATFEKLAREELHNFLKLASDSQLANHQEPGEEWDGAILVMKSPSLTDGRESFVTEVSKL